MTRSRYVGTSDYCAIFAMCFCDTKHGRVLKKWKTRFKIVRKSTLNHEKIGFKIARVNEPETYFKNGN